MWQIIVLALLGLLGWFGFLTGTNIDFFWQGLIVVGVILYLNSDAYESANIFQIIPAIIIGIFLVGMVIGDYTSGRFSRITFTSGLSSEVVTPKPHYQVTEPDNKPLIDTNISSPKFSDLTDWLTSKPFEKK